jgi:hypothetical protein
MTHHITESHRLNGGRPADHPSRNSWVSKTQRILFSEDKIIQCGETAGSNPVKCVKVGTRATLPEPHSTLKPNALTEMAKAFAAAFDAESEGITAQNTAYCDLQQLNQSLSEGILSATTKSIKKEKAAVQEQQQIADYQDKMANIDQDVSWAVLGLGIGLMLLTTVSGFVDFGASDAEIPEEIDMIDMAGQGAAAASDSQTSASVQIDSLTSTIDEEASSSETTAENSTAKKVVSPRYSKALNITGKVLAKLGGMGVRMGLAAALGAPQLMKGIVNLQIAKQMDQLSEAQGKIGPALAQEQRCTMNYQYIQQVNQREGGVIQEDVGDISKIIDTFSSATNGYRSMLFGFANSVRV